MKPTTSLIRWLAWMMFLPALSFAALFASVEAQTLISSDITTDTFWSSSESPYLITQNITVHGTDGDDGMTTLFIEPGTEIRFAAMTGLFIGTTDGAPGAMVTYGMPGEIPPIVFTSSKSQPSRGDWLGITFNPTADDITSVMSLCLVEYAGGSGGSGIHLDNASPIIAQCTVRNSGDAAIRISGPGSDASRIACCYIAENTTGVTVDSDAAPTLQDNTFYKNDTAALVNTSQGTVTAVNNWWGTRGPNSDPGTAVEGNVIYDPWLQEPDLCISIAPDANHPPDPPCCPLPDDGAAECELYGGIFELACTGGDPDPWDSSLTYDLYLGTSPDTLVLEETAETPDWFVFSLMGGQQYYWQVIARDYNGEATEGPVWTFTTLKSMPDLVISSGIGTDLSQYPPGTEVCECFMFANQGNEQIFNFFSVGAHVNGNDRLYCEIDNPYLEPSGFGTGCFCLPVDYAQKTLEIVLDETNVVEESDESNNTLTVDLPDFLDETPPILKSITPENRSHTPAVDIIRFVLSEPESYWKCNVDNAAVINSFSIRNSLDQDVPGTMNVDIGLQDAGFTFTPDLSPLPTDTYRISFDAVNTSGTSERHTIEFSVDSVRPEPPALTGGVLFSGTLQPAPFQNLSNTRDITVTGTRGEETRVRINGSIEAEFGTDDWAAAVLLDEGNNALDVLLEDRSGNLSLPVHADILVDSTPPAVASINPASGSILGSVTSVVISFIETGTALDPDTNLLAVTSGTTGLMDGSWTIQADTLTFTPAEAFVNGDYRIDLRLVDILGNTGAPMESTFTLDTQPPAMPSVEPVRSPTHFDRQLLHGAREEWAAILVNGRDVTGHAPGTTWEYEVSLTPGINSLSIVARDRAGNLSEERAIEIDYNDTPPLPVETLSINPDGDGTQASLSWAGYDETNHGDIAGYRIFAEAEPFMEITGLTALVQLPAGSVAYNVSGLSRKTEYWFAVVAVDLAGQTDPEVTPVPATPVDIIPPGDISNLTAACLDQGIALAWAPSQDIGGDLAGYRILTGSDPATDLEPDRTYAEITGLTRATAYTFTVKAFDTSGNESAGSVITGVTYLANPSDISVTESDRELTLSWSPVLPEALLDQYRIYLSETPFSDISSMTPAALSSTSTKTLTGLTNGILYYLAVTGVNGSGCEDPVVTTVTATPDPDRQGPEITAIYLDGSLLTDSATLTAHGRLEVTATDLSGVSVVSATLDGTPIGSDYSAPFSISLDIATITDGIHTLNISVSDTLGNITISQDYSLTVSMAPPEAPAITAPANGAVVNTPVISVTGTSGKGTEVTLMLNNASAGTPCVIGTSGTFTIPITLDQGVNTIAARAENRAGTSPLSTGVQVALDTAIPEPPNAPTAESRPAGEIKLLWQKPLNAGVSGYNLYRSDTGFSTSANAEKINAAPITVTGHTDLPPREGIWFYGVTSLDAAGNESILSERVSAASDRTQPKAVAIDYAPNGAFDTATGRIGPGRVDIMVSVSEPLAATPFLTLTPSGGIPMPVTLTGTSDTTYTGSVTVAPGSGDGETWAVFSARDLAGNRGTGIDQGERILLDTTGPEVIRLDMVPPTPVRNDSQVPASLTFTIGLNEAVSPGDAPSLTLIYSGGTLQTLTALDPATPANGEIQAWQATVKLPSDIGLAAPETLSMAYLGTDDLGNESDRIQVPSSFQIYQGTLPPLAPPDTLNATATASGRIHLSWSDVDTAAGYHLYRKAPGESALTLLVRLEEITSYTDTTPDDGLYTYAVASVRRENAEESESSPCVPVSVVSDATPPSPPGPLTLELYPQGIYAQWSDPDQNEPVTYTLYRSSLPDITDTEGLTPLIEKISGTRALDSKPSPSEHAYAVTAEDTAGNESPPSESAYLNAGLLPVTNLEITQTDEDPPLISWSHPDDSSAIAGYLAFIGESMEFKVTPEPMTGTEFSDPGYTGENRTYTVIAVDTNNAESLARSITLPVITAELSQETRICRGIMNRAEYTVTNRSGHALNSIRINAELAGRSHLSDTFALDEGESAAVPVIIGGYQTLQDLEPLTTTMEITPNPGEAAFVRRHSEIEIKDQMMVLRILNEECVRGGACSVRFAMENTGAADVEIVTARNGNTRDSGDITWELLDADENVLAASPFRQSLGEVITLPNGTTVARIAPGETFTSQPVDIPIPIAAPDTLMIRLSLGAVYHHLGQDSQVTMTGMTTRHTVTLTETTYRGTVTSAEPGVSNGDQPVLITGTAIDRTSSQPVPQALLDLILTVNGFETVKSVVTDASGTFSYSFSPVSGQGGSYTVAAVHPDLLDRPVQGEFVITMAHATPTTINVSLPRNYNQPLSVTVSTESGTRLTNLRLEPAGTLPTGIHIETESPIASMEPGRTQTLSATLWADNSAGEAGSFSLFVLSDENPSPWEIITVNTRFSKAESMLYINPSHIETGVSPDDTVTESLTVTNQGLADMEEVTLSLEDDAGNPAPSWIRLNTASDLGTLAMGESRSVSITAAPTQAVHDGIYTFYLAVNSINDPTTRIRIYISVTQSGIGNALIKVSDIYTGTLGDDNTLIQGLAGARIQLYNEAVATLSHTLTTDAYGEALFEDLPAGAYKYRISASKHQDTSGRIWVKPGITASEEVFLQYTLVSVEWEVTEITLDDTYEITLNTTYETDVPAAVVVAEPAYVTLPDMQAGDVYQGEFTLTNHGLIRADDLTLVLPESDYFRYEILGTLPQALDAKQRHTVQYRITCLKAPDQSDETGTGGGCGRICITTGYCFICANGVKVCHRTTTCYGSGSCGGGGGSGWIDVPGDGGSVGDGSSSGSSSVRCLMFPNPEEPDECDTYSSTSTGSSVSTLHREYNDTVTDLSVAVPGGRVTVERRHGTRKWDWNDFSTMKDTKVLPPYIQAVTKECFYCYENTLTGQDYCNTWDCSEETGDGDGPEWLTRDVYPYARIASGLYRQGTFTIERRPDCPYDPGTPEYEACRDSEERIYLEDKYLWTDRRGNWRRYDSMGRLMAYGDRKGTLANLIYDRFEARRPSGIADRNGAQVIWYTYAPDGSLTSVSDTRNNQVFYDYTDGLLTAVTDVLGHTTRYEYNDAGLLARKTSPEGRTSTIRYDADGNPVSVLDENGEGYYFNYDYDLNKKEFYAEIIGTDFMIKEIWYNEEGDPNRIKINGRTVRTFTRDGRHETETDAAGNRTYRYHDEWKNRLLLRHPDGSEVKRTYTRPLNLVTTETDENGTLTTFGYDDAGNLLRKIEASGTALERITDYTYDADGNLTAVRTPETLTTMTYDTDGNLTSTTDPEGNTTRFTHDAQGNVLSREAPDGTVVTYAYDGKDRLVGTTRPESGTTAYAYDGDGNRIRQTDSNGTTTFAYDQRNHLIRKTGPDGSSTTQTNTFYGKPVTITDPNGTTTSYGYDQDRRLISIIDGSGNTTQLFYSDTANGCASCSGSEDQPSDITYPTFRREITYDIRGRKSAEADILGSGESYTTRYVYDVKGNLVSKTDRGNRETQYEYDAFNRLVMVVDPLAGTTAYDYDARDNLIRLTDARGNTTRFDYDKNNRLIRETRPMGETTAYTYDANGNLASKTDAKGQLVRHTYNAAGRLTQLRYYRSPADPAPVKAVTFDFDPAGNLTAYSDGTTSAIYTYDAQNRKLSETVDYGPFTKTLSYTYTLNGLKRTFTGPDGITYTYTYDTGNRFASLEIPDAGMITTPSYTWNRPAETLLPGGTTISRDFDALMRTRAITATGVGGTEIMSYDYTLDPMDNITAKQTEHGTYAYTYDSLDRLTAVDNPEIPELTDEGFTYDAVGNRLTSADTSGPWTYNADNELESFDTTRYEYDDNGNMIRKEKNGSVTLFFYNTEDRLERVEDDSGTVIATYDYDPFGRRLRKTVNGATTYFMYADEGLIAEFDADGNLMKFYGYKPGSTWTTDPLFTKSGSDYYFYHNDHLGTPQKLTDKNGTVVWSAIYASFGKADVDSTSTIVNNLRFPGQYYDAESGLHYNWNRYYESIRGCYLKKDPLTISSILTGINYSYRQKIGKIRLDLINSIHKLNTLKVDHSFIDDNIADVYQKRTIRQMLEDPPYFNLYTYAKNNPLKYFDESGNRYGHIITRYNIPCDVKCKAYSTIVCGIIGIIWGPGGLGCEIMMWYQCETHCKGCKHDGGPWIEREYVWM